MIVYSEYRYNHSPSLKERIFWYTLGAIGVIMVGMSIWGLTHIP